MACGFVYKVDEDHNSDDTRVAGPYLLVQYAGDLTVLNAVSLDVLFDKVDMTGYNHFKIAELIQKFSLYFSFLKNHFSISSISCSCI